MKVATLRMCRAWSVDVHHARQDVAHTLYHEDALVTRSSGVAVLVNHDYGQRVGRVLEHYLYRDAWDGTPTTWHACRIEGDLPDWVKPGTPVSIGGVETAKYADGPVEVVTRELWEEVSILSPAHDPANTGAMVLTVREAPTRATRIAAEDEHPAIRAARIARGRPYTKADEATISALLAEGVRPEDVAALMERTK